MIDHFQHPDCGPQYHPRWLSSKESPTNAGDAGMIPGFGGSPGGGNGNPLQYSCLEKILCTEEPGGLQSVVSQRVGQDSANEHACRHHFFIKESEDPQSNDCPLFLRQQINKMNLQRLETLEGKKAFEDPCPSPSFTPYTG